LPIFGWLQNQPQGIFLPRPRTEYLVDAAPLPKMGLFQVLGESGNAPPSTDLRLTAKSAAVNFPFLPARRMFGSCFDSTENRGLTPVSAKRWSVPGFGGLLAPSNKKAAGFAAGGFWTAARRLLEAINASRTALRDVLYAGRLSYARLRGHRG
jgi:hypothetical protein